MAGKQSGNMTSFVQSRNPASAPAEPPDHAPDDKPDYSEFKVPVGKKPAAATRATTRRKSQQQSDTPKHRDSNEEKPFYDTDASSLDTQSTTPNVQTRGAISGNQIQPEPPEDYDSEDDNSEESEEDNEEDLPPNPSPDEEKQQFGVARIRGQEQAAAILDRGAMNLHGASLPRMKGDSYPTTTSGRLSPAETAVDNPQPLLRDPPHISSTVRASQDDSSVQHHTSARQPLRREHHDGRTIQNGLLVRPDLDNLKPHFAYPKALDRQVPLNSRPKPDQKHVSHQGVVNRARVNSTAHPIRLATTREAPTRAAEQLQSHARAADVTSKAQKQHRSSKTDHEHVVAEAEQRPRARVTAKVEPLSDDQDDAERLSSTDAYIQTQEEPEHEQSDEELEDESDYQEAALFQMSYNELKEQPFDFNPKSQPFNFPPDQQNNSLEGKLEYVRQFQASDQSKFFANLPIQQWEQAGDWFLGRFGGILEKLKKARQDKRTAAKVFEDEIEKRHEAVSKKRKQTDDELHAMKESGGKVLQGTPKRARKSK